MNKHLILGRITKDLELRHTKNNKAVVTFSVATKRNYKPKDGEAITDFFTVVSYGAQAEHIAKYCKKGDMILIDGETQNRNYTDKDGIKRYITETISHDIKFISKAQNKTENHENSSEYIPVAEYDDDLPF